MQVYRNSAIDPWLIGLIVSLSAIGFIAMSSASIEFSARYYGDPFFHALRYLLHLGLGVAIAFLVYQLPMTFWQRTAVWWLFFGLVLLLLVLIPGIGREVNGSQRWLPLGPLTIQCSEIAKFSVIIYLARYLVRHQQEVRQQWSGFVKPMAVLFAITLLLMLEPDFGATIVTLSIALGMIFLAGVRLWHFLLAILGAVLALLSLVIFEPYRLQRLTAFMDPWADQFNSGYQLTQSLIAFGRGEWFGVGLGNSVQKLFYLPEAHTDFVFAIFAEEFGVFGALLAIILFAALLLRLFQIGRAAEQRGQCFNAYVAYGIAWMISAQVIINMGVNTGLLPTKGLTLPFLSYGGSSLIICCVLLGIACRIYRELSSTSKRHQKRKLA